MTKATGMGLVVCRPFSDSQAFDFLACTPSGAVLAIQVKSCWRRANHGEYSVVTGPRYREGAVDFVAVCIVPEEAWYIIPAAVASRNKGLGFYPHIPNSRGRLEKYREAWHLLLRPRRGRSEGGLEIRACADPAYADSTAEIAEITDEFNLTAAKAGSF
ncbi:MAG: hypothetical protein LAN37_01350 [Acidobacteriia bacterium]|nr:hypothetical protein [Terriglobia bacterium]